MLTSGATPGRAGSLPPRGGSFALMGLMSTFLGWPVVRQLVGSDPLGRGAAAQSPAAANFRPRTETADRVVKSICPYCAVGYGQNV